MGKRTVRRTRLAQARMCDARDDGILKGIVRTRGTQ